MFKETRLRSPLLIAEIGGNHEGDFAKARDLVDLAISSGADCVKLQVYAGDKLVSSRESPDRNSHFKKFELSLDQHLFLAEQVKSAGLVYSASIWDFESMEALDPYLDFYKIGSGDMTHYPMLEFCAKRAKPILLSTGLATFDEVSASVSHIRNVNELFLSPEYLCVLQCTSMYPISFAEANLAVMSEFKEKLDVSVGYSDHTIGIYALEIATAMGAQVLEFHFTDDPTRKEFRDHQVSLTSTGVRELKQKIEWIFELQGSCEKKPQSSEIANGHLESFRRGVYLNKEIKKGRTVTLEDLEFLRPAKGVDVRRYCDLIGAVALRDLEPFVALTPGLDFDVEE